MVCLADKSPDGGTEPRLAAFRILQRLEEGQLFELARDRELKDLSGKDRALAHQIAAGVLRSRNKLDGAISKNLKHPWAKVQTKLRNVLRVGAYQLIFLDRIPRYAAVNTGVEICKTAVGSKQAPLVNAVLRKLGPDSVSVRDCKTPWDLANEYSHPDWLVERWVRAFGFEKTEALLSRNNVIPSVTLRPINTTLEELKETLTASSVPFRDSALSVGVSVAHAMIAQLPGYDDGEFIVQDPAQAYAIEFAELPGGGLIWDACAAPGGKSIVIGENNSGLVSSDFTTRRVKLLRTNLNRVKNEAPIVCADGTCPPFRKSSMDAVVVDAPCSATGTLRKHPDARWRINKRTIRQAAETQSKLLESAAEVVKPGGLLVYLTCSLEKEENQGVVDAFLESHPEFERTREDLSIFPDDYGTDGAYGARLTKKV